MSRSARSLAPTPVAPNFSVIAPDSRSSAEVPNLKTCSACHEAKVIGQFARNRAQRDGFDGQCRVCVKVRKANAYRQKKIIEESKRRPIASNRVLDVANLKIIKALQEAPPDDFDQRLQGVISMLVDGGAA